MYILKSGRNFLLTFCLIVTCKHVMIVEKIRRCKRMIIEIIHQKLKDKLAEEQHKVLQLEWQKSRLEHKLELAKREERDARYNECRNG